MEGKRAGFFFLHRERERERGAIAHPRRPFFFLTLKLPNLTPKKNQIDEIEFSLANFDGDGDLLAQRM